MAKALAFMASLKLINASRKLVLLARLVLSKQKELITIDRSQILLNNKEAPSYSFDYGVSDIQTGDVKTVWETKEGDTVKGHYSVLEPDGSVRTVEYSASPGKGFTAAINNEGVNTPTLVTDQPKIEDKSYRDYKKPYEYSEDSILEFYSSPEKRNKKRPYDGFYKDYSMFKRPTHSSDSEPSHADFPYNLPSKHLYDDIGFDSPSHGHIGLTHDSNCKTKHKKENTQFYKNLEDLDFRKYKKPLPYTEAYNYEKYGDSSNDDTDKYLQRHLLKGRHKSPRPDEIGLPTSIKYSYPVIPDMPPLESFYRDEVQRPKKKYRPHKNTEGFYSSDDISDYVFVPKKKMKKLPRVPDISDYVSDFEEDYDHFDDDDDRNHKPHRESGQKEVVRKIVKKRKPSIINLLDILDI